jgi:hypothetical protein
VSDELAVLDWRRRVAALYAAVRAEPDRAGAHAVWANERSELMATHPASPLLPEHRAGTRVQVAPYDPAARFVAPLEPAGPQRLEVPTGTDGTVVLDRIGTVRVGDLGTLDVWWLAGYGGGVFVPLRDGASGVAVGDAPAGYGGGRYVLDTVKGADLGSADDGRLVVDLNFAYHPSCAYDPAWACPLAPPGNRLTAPVVAGERYAGPWAHSPD